MKRSLLISLCIFVIALFLYWIKPVMVGSQDYNFSTVDHTIENEDLNGIINTFKANSIINPTFEFKISILDSIDQSNLNSIITVTDSLFYLYHENRIEVLQNFSKLLTEHNQTLQIHSNNSQILDSLFYILSWAKNFSPLSKIYPDERSIFYQSIYDYWMSEIVRRLEVLDSENHEIRFSIKYRILNDLCEQAQYSPVLRTSNIDKVLYNIQNSRFGYIAGRFYLIFGFLGIFIGVLMTLITLVSYYCLFTKLKAKSSKWKRN